MRKVFHTLARIKHARAAEDETGPTSDAVPADAFTFDAEISNNHVDAYFTRMDIGTLRNFARDARAGRSLLDSHKWDRLGVGYSYDGRFEEDDQRMRTLGSFYIQPGIQFGGQHSFASTDDFIRAIRANTIRDVSVGFSGGEWICDLCGQRYFSSECQHYAGARYEIKDEEGSTQNITATVTIRGATLNEVSLVYDGATPEAAIQKAENRAEQGELDEETRSMLENQLGIRIQPRMHAVPVEPRAAGALNDQAGSGRAGEPDLGESEGVEPEMATRGINHTQYDEGETMNELAEVARILDAPSEEWHDIRAALEHALDEREALSRDVADLTGQVEVLEARVAELSPLADDGRAYRAALVDEALHEGVRAMGESFPEETYRDMLKEADIDGIRRVRDAFRAKADELFQAGRQSVTETEDDDTEASGPAPEMEFDTSVPARAYGAVA